MSTHVEPQLTNLKRDEEEEGDVNENESHPASPGGKVAPSTVSTQSLATKDVEANSSQGDDGRVVPPPANMYCKLVAKHPLMLCLILLIINLGVAPLAIVIRGRPDFSDPKIGIEARGTEESEAEHTYRLLKDLQKNTAGCEELKCDEGDKKGDCSITFTRHATQCPENEYQKQKVRRMELRTSEEEISPMLHPHLGPWDDRGSTTVTPLAPGRTSYGHVKSPWNATSTARVLQASTNKCPGWTHGRLRLWEMEDKWDIFDLNKGVVGFAYGLEETEGCLLEPAKLKSMCETGKSLASDDTFAATYCLVNANADGSCCPPESLASFVSFVAGKEETCDITQEDSDKARQLISDCHPYREHLIKAAVNWMISMVESVPSSRTQLNATRSPEEAEFVHQINKALAQVGPQKCKDRYIELASVYEYLIDDKWQPGTQVKSSNVYVPVMPIDQHDASMFTLYTDLLAPKMYEQELQAVGIKIENPNGRFGVFDKSVIEQGKWAFLSFIIIYIIMVLHNGSFIISAMAFGQIVLSLLLTVFLYQIIFWVPYFPFMNLVSLFVLIAIGVDDVFIYYDTWSQSFHVLAKDTPMEDRVQWTLKRAGSAMLMTSVTTSAAFLSNIVSSVTAVKLFSIFSSLAIMADFFLMLTMLPCIVLLGEGMCQGPKWVPSLRLCPLKEDEPRNIEAFLATKFVNLIFKIRYPMILIMTAWGIFCFVDALGMPNPANEDLPMWVQSHPLEVWNLDYRPLYSGTTVKGQGLRVKVNIGYKLEDNGYYLNPTTDGRGTVQYVKTNFASQASQNYYSDVCEQAKKLSWVDPLVSEKDTPEEYEFDILCWPLAFKKWQKSPDAPSICRNYPVEENNFYECLYTYLDDTDRWTGENFFFDMETKEMNSMHLYVKTTKEWRAVFDYMSDLYQIISSWGFEQVKNAPAELSEVNWCTEFRYFALQKALKDGALMAAALSLILALVAIFLMTKRLDVSFLSIICIFMTLSCVVACMKWQGWTIGVNEAAIFSIAVGMSVDFVCHLAYAYCHATYDSSSTMEEREFRLRFALGTVGISVSAAAFTTLVGGSAMIFSVVLFYNRFGIYFVLTMLWSWLYAFFYFTSLMSVVGPKISTSSLSLGSLFSSTESKKQKYMVKNGDVRDPKMEV